LPNTAAPRRLHPSHPRTLGRATRPDDQDRAWPARTRPTSINPPRQRGSPDRGTDDRELLRQTVTPHAHNQPQHSVTTPRRSRTRAYERSGLIRATTPFLGIVEMSGRVCRSRAGDFYGSMSPSLGR
jgi:hypothetical protein